MRGFVELEALTVTSLRDEMKRSIRGMFGADYRIMKLLGLMSNGKI